MTLVPFVDVFSMHLWWWAGRWQGERGKQEMNSASSYSAILILLFASFLSTVFLLGFLERLFSLGLL